MTFLGLDFQAEAARRKVDLKRFDGDGLGTLPNGKKTPQHSDLVFQDGKSGKLTSTQMKFSDDRANIPEMVEKFHNTHSGKPNDSGYSELDLKNTEIAVPKGMEQKNMKIKVDGKEVTVSTTSKVKVGDVTVDTPTVSEMKEFVDKNFDLMKKIQKDDHLGLQKRLMDKRTGIPKMRNDLKNKNKALANIEDSDVKKRLQDEVKALEVIMILPKCSRFSRFFQIASLVKSTCLVLCLEYYT